jgi:RHS repeat-associated protein
MTVSAACAIDEAPPRAVTDTYDYDAFGNKINSTGTTPNSYLYRGEQYDSDLGLYYLRARYYNPLTGRFMSRDPEDGNRLNPTTLHKYLYAGGDPVNRLDPTGRAELFQSALITGGSALTTTEASIAFVGGTAAEIAEVMSQIAVTTAEITQLLAEASAAAAEGLADAAGDFLLEAVDVYSELLQEEGLVGAATRALTCAEVSLVAVQILEEQAHISKDWGHTIEIVGTGACAVRLELLAK